MSSSKQSTPPTSRKDRRAAERRDRFEVERDERRARAAGRGGGSSSGLSTRMVTIGAIVVGLAIIALVAVNQLGSRFSGELTDPGTNYPASLLDGTAIGAADAKVTLDVYEDYQCPVCGQFSLTVEPVLVSRYVGNGTLRIVHHDIAFLGRGGADDESLLAASGATCADQQGLYWPYAHWVYANQDGENAGGFRRERLLAIAEAAGVDRAAFESCLTADATVQGVAATTQAAVGMGINSTPTLYLGDQQIVGLRSADELGALIEAAAAAAASPSASPSAVP